MTILTKFIYEYLKVFIFKFIYLFFIFITRVKYNKLQFVFIIHSLHYKSNPAEENIFLIAGPAYLKTNLKLVLIWLVNIFYRRIGKMLLIISRNNLIFTYILFL